MLVSTRVSHVSLFFSIVIIHILQEDGRLPNCQKMCLVLLSELLLSCFHIAVFHIAVGDRGGKLVAFNAK